MATKTSSKHTAHKKTTRPAKSAIPDRWNLSHLAVDPVRTVDTHLGAIERLVTDFESSRPALSPTMDAAAFQSSMRALINAILSSESFLYRVPAAPEANASAQAGPRTPGS